MGRGARSYYVVVSEAGKPVSRHQTVTAAAKRIKRDGAAGRWTIKSEGMWELHDIVGDDKDAADAILYPALGGESP